MLAKKLWTIVAFSMCESVRILYLVIGLPAQHCLLCQLYALIGSVCMQYMAQPYMSRLMILGVESKNCCI